MEFIPDIIDNINRYIELYTKNSSLLNIDKKIYECNMFNNIFDNLDMISDKIDIITDINSTLFANNEFLKYKLTEFKFSEYKKISAELLSYTKEIMRSCSRLFLSIKDQEIDTVALLDDYEFSSRSDLGIEYFAHALKLKDDAEKALILKRDIIEVIDTRTELKIHPAQHFFDLVKPSRIDDSSQLSMISMPNSNYTLVYNIRSLLNVTNFNKKSGLCPKLINGLNSIYINENPVEKIADKLAVAEEYTFDGVKSFKLTHIENGVEPATVEINRMQDEYIVKHIGDGTVIPEFDDRILIPKSEIITKILFYIEKRIAEIKKSDRPNDINKICLNINSMTSFVGRAFYDIHSAYYKKQKGVSRQIYHSLYAKILENVLLFSTIFKQNVHLNSENVSEYRNIITTRLPTEIKLTYY